MNGDNNSPESPPNDWISAAHAMQTMLLGERRAEGWWEGRLSTSALSTATAVMALMKAWQASPRSPESGRRVSLIQGGLEWLASHQNPDGGWGDTVLSISNISTTMLAHAVFRFHAVLWAEGPAYQQVIDRSGAWIDKAGGVPAVLRRYGKDRTFSVPILTHCALAGIVNWKDVIPLPFELSCIPHTWYAAVRMPVVSYALPALIAIGQVIFHHQGHPNPIVRWIRRRSRAASLAVLESIQPPNGGFLEATPLTSFVCMSLLGCGLQNHPVTQRCLAFIEASVRDDGSWPIDTNLTTWVTTLSIQALSSESNGLMPHTERAAVRNWLLRRQYSEVHPYTHAAPGGWSWTDLPGGVPDADDTPGGMLALLALRDEQEEFTDEERHALQAAGTWLLNLQNRDGGWPTFCRGWGALPFDRSSCDLTAHALRALTRWEERIAPDPTLRIAIRNARVAGLRFLEKSQRADGSWLPLWFGHQFNHDDENPLYGTSRVLRALSDLKLRSSPMTRRALEWVIGNQNEDGGWSARRGLLSSVEETGLALDSIAGFSNCPVVEEAGEKGAAWLSAQVHEGTVRNPAPIGFYFARLWYFEELYPIIFATLGLTRWRAVRNRTDVADVAASE